MWKTHNFGWKMKKAQCLSPPKPYVGTLFWKFFGTMWMAMSSTFRIWKKIPPDRALSRRKMRKTGKIAFSKKTFLVVIFMNSNVWLRFIFHNMRLEILHRLIYHTIYNTWILKTFPYNNRWKFRTAISRHYRNLEGYGNWKIFITKLDL